MSDFGSLNPWVEVIGLLIWVVLISGTMLVALVVPLIVLASEIPALRRWPLVVFTASYMLGASILGLMTYVLVPAQYSKYHDFRRSPQSDSLGGIHAAWLQRAGNRDAIPPDRVPAVQEEVAAERAEFVREWALMTGAGLVSLWVILVLRRLPRGGRGETRGRLDTI